jgi:hypothetical protein
MRPLCSFSVHELARPIPCRLAHPARSRALLLVTRLCQEHLAFAVARTAQSSALRPLGVSNQQFSASTSVLCSPLSPAVSALMLRTHDELECGSTHSDSSRRAQKLSEHQLARADNDAVVM